MLEIPTSRLHFTDSAQRATPLFIFDFDGVFHTKHTNYEMYMSAAVKTVVAYTDLPSDEARNLCALSWEERRDVMEMVVEHPKCSADHETIYRHYNFLLHDSLKLSAWPKIKRDTFHNLQKRGNIAILSHSPTKLLHTAGIALDLSPHIVMNNAYGLDRVGGHHKDRSANAVLQICQEFETDPTNAVLIDDTAINLPFAKAAGLSTLHINREGGVVDWNKYNSWAERVGWEEPIPYADVVDISQLNTRDAMRALESKYPVLNL